MIRTADPESIAAAAALLQAGGLVAFPTETVYGLGADATDETAVARVYRAKERPAINPLIVHVRDRDAAADCVRFDERARALADRFWPGALTLVLPRRETSALSLLACAGLETAAVRVPDHPVAQDLLVAAGRPLAAPSANRSGRISPTTAAHVAESLDARVDLILDGGPCPIGIESTIVDLSGDEPALLRPGGVIAKDIEGVIGPLREPSPGQGRPRSPGLLDRHYAPAVPLRLNASAPRPGEALLAFGGDAPARSPDSTLNLSRTGDLEEAAANLFAMLRALDRPEHATIAVMPVPGEGLGRAINDRLRRAACRSEGT